MPDERCELTVLSKLLYYLAPGALEVLIERVRGSLEPGGLRAGLPLAATHW